MCEPDPAIIPAAEPDSSARTRGSSAGAHSRYDCPLRHRPFATNSRAEPGARSFDRAGHLFEPARTMKTCVSCGACPGSQLSASERGPFPPGKGAS
ncbi:transcriptional regulator, Crp/Fnr family [Frigoriglobus tundricola]|uniref:Transcriptional regulator, Crp/Fnr family n=1 Tax=Frigoriglobus tundricola TaxID=2774151 RepID=A0A6M5YXJ0_9BACT|nr:transcriptional regulator, Crp/Fnr family [Frigoriglobus tundricola]